MKKEIICFMIIFAIMVNLCSYGNNSSAISPYVFVKQWGSIGKKEGEFGGLYIASDSTYIITDEIIESLKNKIDKNKLKLLEPLKNKEFDKDEIVLSGFGCIDHSGEFIRALEKLGFNDAEIGMLMLASATKKLSDTEINGPLYITVDKYDNIYVSDYYNGKIKKFDSDGKFLLKWSDSSSYKGITIDANGYIYVVESYKNCVQKFDSSGKLILKFGSQGDKDEQFNWASALALDNEGYIYVIDNFIIYQHDFPLYRSYVKKFDSSGNFINKWDQRFACYDIKIDKNGYFFLTKEQIGRSIVLKLNSLDYISTRIEWILDDKKLGLKGSIKIALDSEGNVFAVSRDNSCVYKINSAGKVIAQWGSFGSGEGQFNRPEAITVDSKGNVYVMDTGNYRIQKFAPNPEYKQNK